jgi:fatty acid desaturase
MEDKKTLPQRMDDMVRWTGIPQGLTDPSRRRRPLRWLSTLAAGAALAGFIASAAAGFSGRAMWIGYTMLMAGFTIGTLVQVFGPLKPFGSSERVDEFDKALRDRAYLFTFPIFALTTLLGVILLMFMIITQWSRPALVMCLTDLALLLVTVGSALPTAYASWAVEWHKDDG